MSHTRLAERATARDLVRGVIDNWKPLGASGRRASTRCAKLTSACPGIRQHEKLEKLSVVPHLRFRLGTGGSTLWSDEVWLIGRQASAIKFRLRAGHDGGLPVVQGGGFD